ncbi:MAG: glycosyl transferase [Bacteroidetes bacterium]|nr:MAG: glycosyl transferase [Bacteroidota bacterium]
MSIPKVIYQTYKTSKLPLIFRWHIYRLRKKNPDYDYQFYDDKRVEKFIYNELGEESFNLFKRINIGAAKADFFRYAILYKKGGIYLDLDSRILYKIDDFIKHDDKAVLSFEDNKKYFIQFALFFEPGHPFLKRTLELIIANMKNNISPYDSHKMMGPAAFTQAINESLYETPNIGHRILGIDYENKVEFSFPMSKTFLYGISRKNHWKKLCKTTPVMSADCTEYR